MFENIFETVNAAFAQAMYEDYLRDPNSVPPGWRELFERKVRGAPPSTAEEQKDEAATGRPAPRAATATGHGSGVPGTEPINELATPPGASSKPITGPALRLFQNMEASLALPTATSFRDVDVSLLWRVRAQMNRELKGRGLKLSFTHFVGWAIVQAARRYPTLTHAVTIRDRAPHRVAPGGVNLGLAVDVEEPGGRRKLLVPVIKNAGALSFGEFHGEYERLVAGAREGKLLPDAYQGATITLTNPGTLGTVASVPRLMAGQGSIIATGAIRELGGQRIMTITSTYDHRIIQGAESGLFLQAIDAMLQGENGFYSEIAAEMGLGEPLIAERPETIAAVSERPATPTAAGAAAVDESLLYHVAAAMSIVRHHRAHGYLAAHLDPLGTPPKGDPALDPEKVGLTPEIMRRIPARVLRTYVGGETMEDVLPRLRETYCGSIAYEIEHIASHEERVWLRRVIESGEHRHPLADGEKRRLLSELIRVDVLETFLHKNYLGHKRFGIEGLDMLVPMLHHAIDLAAEQGTREAVIGMAHRGRLNVLAHVLGVPYETLLAEFEGGREVEETLTPVGGTGDVKYHHGRTGAFQTWRGESVTLTLMPNPSHLEAVDPVVEGNARARQTDRSGPVTKHDASKVLPILIHGDAAFAAQGVVAETLNLERLEGYGTGGTLHIIANNQIGFTTPPKEGRSTDFASDLAKGYDIPIVHVNADDPEACLAAVRLSIGYRKKFRGDLVINLVGYRRHGHNEGDEPRYTQPTMYNLIDRHPPVREIYARALAEQKVLTLEDANAEMERIYAELTETQARLKADLQSAEREGEEPVRISAPWTPVGEPDTSLDPALLREINEELLRVPSGFRVNRKLARVMDRRRAALAGEGAAIDWAHAEALALAALLTEGVPLRLVGQDTVRGTFSQRHLTLFDAETGDAYTPMQNLSRATAPLELHNSPLSEYGALGFEYGYSAAAPDVMVMWEAQFGDFANAAEVIIDQFIIAGLAKWGLTSRLTLLLPHGYEGQGPEHSSARLERYLALGAEGNIRVANCSTPSQYFHLLRRQAKHDEIRPLIVMTPKSLLRHPRATSAPEELSGGQFSAVLDDTTLPGPRDDVTRLALCSGKIFYDVITSPERAEARHVAVGRIELLYPFPEGDVHELVRRYPNIKEVVWLQEEPSNMGARKWAVPQIEAQLPEDVSIHWTARPERSSPAEGYPAAHQAEQERLVREVLA